MLVSICRGTVFIGLCRYPNCSETVGKQGSGSRGKKETRQKNLTGLILYKLLIRFDGLLHLSF